MCCKLQLVERPPGGSPHLSREMYVRLKLSSLPKFFKRCQSDIKQVVRKKLEKSRKYLPKYLVFAFARIKFTFRGRISKNPWSPRMSQKIFT